MEELFRKKSFIEDNLLILKEYLEFYELNKEDLKTFLAIKRLSEEIIESMIKVNQILLRKKMHFPVSYKKSFLDMKKFYGMKSVDLEEISKTAEFRNELAHEYQDMHEIYAIRNAKVILKLYPKYLKELLKIIKNDKN